MCCLTVGRGRAWQNYPPSSMTSLPLPSSLILRREQDSEWSALFPAVLLSCAWAFRFLGCFVLKYIPAWYEFRALRPNDQPDIIHYLLGRETISSILRILGSVGAYLWAKYPGKRNARAQDKNDPLVINGGSGLGLGLSVILFSPVIILTGRIELCTHVPDILGLVARLLWCF